MNIVEKRFLEALKAALNNKTVYWKDLSRIEWQQLFALSNEQGVVPMIYQATKDCLVAEGQQTVLQQWSPLALKRVARQLIKTKDFLEVYGKLCEKGIRPVLVKGMICRNLYPFPEQRISLDEDLLIPAEDFDVCHQVLLDYGMYLPKKEQNPVTSTEVSYWKTNTKLYIEVHKKLFPDESEVYSEFNALFQDSYERAITTTYNGIAIHTLEPTDHMLYLICHSFKHFLGQGLGIRLVCDMLMFAQTYGEQLDWKMLLEQCKKVNADRLVATMFFIGEKYLGFDAAQMGFPQEWKRLKEDETDLLFDILHGGILGNANMSHMHSATITLNAIIAHKKGKKAKGSLVKTVSPIRKYMKKDYVYLEKHPYLLPVAWTSRIVKYAKAINRSNEPRKSIEIGNRRVELFKKYGVFK